MSYKPPALVKSKKNTKKTLKHSIKDLKKEAKPMIVVPPPTFWDSLACGLTAEPPKIKPEPVEPSCNRAKFYRSPEEKRKYLENEVVPILMEGLLGLAREKPQDPITYLNKFWLKDQHLCAVELPQNIL